MGPRMISMSRSLSQAAAESRRLTRNIRIGEAFKKTEEARLFVMDVDVVAVEYRRHSSYNVSVPARDKIGGFGVFEKGVLVAEDEFHFAQKRRDPVRVSLIHLPGKADELV